MKKLFQLVIATALATAALSPQQASAQAPQKMSYQAILRDADGALLKDQKVGIRITVLKNTTTEVYKETHMDSTNSNGLVVLEIGSGTAVGTNTFAAIDWGDGVYSIKTATDPDGASNYTIEGETKLLSVPYALYAAKSGESSGNSGTTYVAGSGIAISGDTIIAKDTSATNEIQTLSDVLDQSNDAGNQKITGLASPTANQDAATKKYVDDRIAGVSSGTTYVAGSGIAISGNTIAAEDTSATNEMQTLSEVLMKDSSAGNKRIINLGDPQDNQDAATKKYVDGLDTSATNEMQTLNQVLMEGADASNKKITGLASPTEDQDAATKKYVDGLDTSATNEMQTLSDVLMEGADAGNKKITGLASPTEDQDAATKKYVDGLDTSATNELELPSGGADGQVLAATGNPSNYKWIDLPSGGGGGGTTYTAGNGINISGTVIASVDTLKNLLARGSDAGNRKITGVALPTADQDVATKKYVDGLDTSATNEMQTLSEVLVKDSSAGGKRITNLGTPQNDQDAATKKYVDGLDTSATNEMQTLSQVLMEDSSAGNKRITNLGTPQNDQDAATKKYVDEKVAAGGGSTLTVSETGDTLKMGSSFVIVPGISAANRPLRIGDFAHGGVVFYVDGTGKHGLVCAVEDQVREDYGIMWDVNFDSDDPVNTNTPVNGTSEVLGTGQTNTDSIVATLGTPTDFDPESGSYDNYAAYVCDQFVSGGYDDWYLPSKAELDSMVAHKDAINATAVRNGGNVFYATDDEEEYSDGSPHVMYPYWSSTQSATDLGKVWLADFLTNEVRDDHAYSSKDAINLVRAVRKF